MSLFIFSRLAPKMSTEDSKTTTTKSKTNFSSISEIRPYLFISGYIPINPETIRDLGITHAVDVANLIKPERVESVEYMEIKVDDNELANLQSHFEDVAQFIQKAKNSNGKTLVYCAAGISRSATLCMMYLVIAEDFSLRDAFIEVRKVRPIISPNPGFWRQMIDYETAKKGSSSVALQKSKIGRYAPDIYF